MMKHTVLFCILFNAVLLNGQSKDSVIKQIVHTSKSFKTYEVLYLNDMKFQSSDDTMVDTVHAFIVKKGNSIVCINSETKKKNGYQVKTAYNGRYQVSLYNNKSYSVLDARRKKALQRIQKINKELDYMPLHFDEKMLKKFKGFDGDRYHADFWTNDTTKNEFIAGKLITKEILHVNLITGLIDSSEDWAWFEGGVQYRKSRLIMIKELANHYRDTIQQKADLNITDFKTYLSQDSINRQFDQEYVLLKSGDSMLSFGARVYGSLDSLTLTPNSDSILVLDFFYTTCGPCAAAVPELKKLDSMYRSRGVYLFGVDPFSSDWIRLSKFNEYYKMTYPVLQVPHSVSKLFGVSGYPTLFIIHKGIVYFVEVGYSKDILKILSSKLDELLKY